MESNSAMRRLWLRPALVPAVLAPETHESVVVPFAATAASVPVTATFTAGGYGTDGPVGSPIAGKDIPRATQLAGDVRGVPPRGKPV